MENCGVKQKNNTQYASNKEDKCTAWPMEKFKKVANDKKYTF